MKRKADGAISNDSSEDKMSGDILKAKGCKIAVKKMDLYISAYLNKHMQRNCFIFVVHSSGP